MKYALNLDNETKRILSACFVNKFTPDFMPRVDKLPTGETEAEQDITNWLYVNKKYVFEPIEEVGDTNE